MEFDWQRIPNLWARNTECSTRRNCYWPYLPTSLEWRSQLAQIFLYYLDGDSYIYKCAFNSHCMLQYTHARIYKQSPLCILLVVPRAKESLRWLLTFGPLNMNNAAAQTSTKTCDASSNGFCRSEPRGRRQISYSTVEFSVAEILNWRKLATIGLTSELLTDAKQEERKAVQNLQPLQCTADHPHIHYSLFIHSQFTATWRGNIC